MDINPALAHLERGVGDAPMVVSSRKQFGGLFDRTEEALERKRQDALNYIEK